MQQQAAMNALYDQELAAEFAATFRLDSLEKLVMDVTSKDKGISGTQLSEAVYKKITQIDENIRYPDTAGGCFIKGTPITTKEGWKRIEEIKVGDWVLSSPEDGSGKPEYKRVVNTFVHRNKTVRSIRFCHDGKRYRVIATGNHPFWVEGAGWTRADLLKKGNALRHADGRSARVESQVPVYKFCDEKWWGNDRVGKGIGFTYEGRFPPLADPVGGRLFDYENYLIPANQQAEMGWDEMREENYLEVTVYNLEVEGTHTYFASGLWVHNSSDKGVSVIYVFEERIT
jgi:hypothetical protein